MFAKNTKDGGSNRVNTKDQGETHSQLSEEDKVRFKRKVLEREREKREQDSVMTRFRKAFRRLFKR